MTTNNNLDTVAAFIDGERIDTDALKRALSTNEGRDYLVELVAMREVIATSAMATGAPATVSKGPTRAWWIVSAAAVVLAVAGGFAIGSTRAVRVAVAESKAAPAPTVVVTNVVGWRESKGGN